MDVKKSVAVSIFEAKTILSKRKEEGELGYEQSQALEHAERFAETDHESSIKKLTKNDKITHEAAIKLIDCTSKTPATIRAILSKEKIEVSDDEISVILKELE
ncbi:hypothetical protein HY990_06025 [Candidatus Micrarchaeota archaeon]|nr:hypothetical protein [Candidatus Micrarchaeota archaeon]